VKLETRVVGISAFPVCETLLLQTSMFTHCFGYSGFYGEATMALFLVGLPLMMAQNRWDQYYDTMSAERWGGAQVPTAYACTPSRLPVHSRPSHART
jgi:hypothetical protein